MDREGFQAADVLAIDGVSVAGDAFDGSIMKHMVSSHFGAEVTYRMPLGSNDLRIPRYLVEKMCSAADISFLARGDILRLLRDAQRWSLQADDQVKMENLFVLVEEHLGYELFAEIERSKKNLSQLPQSQFQFEHSGIRVCEELGRADFQVFAQNLVELILAKLDSTLQQAGLDRRQVDLVCCTGGTAHLPAIQHALRERFGSEKLRQFKNFHSVIQGLAFHARKAFAN